jgi:excisionase family DNA binding protein
VFLTINQEMNMSLANQLTVQQVAAKIGVSLSSVWRMTKEGKLPQPRKLGAMTTRWDEAEVIEAIGKMPRLAA